MTARVEYEQVIVTWQVEPDGFGSTLGRPFSVTATYAGSGEAKRVGRAPVDEGLGRSLVGALNAVAADGWEVVDVQGWDGSELHWTWTALLGRPTV